MSINDAIVPVQVELSSTHKILKKMRRQDDLTNEECEILDIIEQTLFIIRDHILAYKQHYKNTDKLTHKIDMM